MFLLQGGLHFVMAFQKLGYIFLKHFLQSKLFLARLALINMLVGLNMICHNVSLFLTTRITEKFPSSLPVTVKHSSGNCFTLSRALTVLGSLEPSPRALLLPLGGGLQSTLRLRILNDKGATIEPDLAVLSLSEYSSIVKCVLAKAYFCYLCYK